LQLDGARVLFTDTRDNELYTEVTIGSQIWMGENLRAVKFNDGTPIPLVKDNTEWEKTEEPAYCWYDNKKSVYKGSAYGALYNWFAVNTGKLCPVGWHVPSESEWQTLTNYVGDSIQNDDGYLILENKIAGMKLKEAGYLNWNFNDTIVSTNEFGFTALPGGFRTIYGVFWGIREEGNWWSSTEERYGEKKDDARDIEMNCNSNETAGMHQYKQTGMSVRCIRDSIH
jgi:uncharacterized protein (TIGR02145 family)